METNFNMLKMSIIIAAYLFDYLLIAQEMDEKYLIESSLKEEERDREAKINSILKDKKAPSVNYRKPAVSGEERSIKTIKKKPEGDSWDDLVDIGDKPTGDKSPAKEIRNDIDVRSEGNRINEARNPVVGDRPLPQSSKDFDNEIELDKRVIIDLKPNKELGDQKNVVGDKKDAVGEKFRTPVNREQVKGERLAPGINNQSVESGNRERVIPRPGVNGESDSVSLRLPDVGFDPETEALIEAINVNDIGYRHPMKEPRKLIITDTFVGVGPNYTQAFGGTIGLNIYKWVIGGGYERAQWLDVNTNTGKYVESIFADGCAAMTFDTSWFSFQPCFRYGVGYGNFKERNALNEIVSKDKNRSVSKTFGRFILLLDAGDDKIAVEGITGYSEDPFLYGAFIQATVKTPILGLMAGFETYAGQRNAFILGYSLGVLDLEKFYKGDD